MRHVGPQKTLDGLWHVLHFDIVEEIACHRRVGAVATADQNMKTFDGIAVVGDRHAAGDQPDVANVVLRAGVMAAGQVNIDRTVERHAGLAPAGDVFCMALCIRRRELAAAVAGAGDQAGADRRSGNRKLQGLDRGLHWIGVVVPVGYLGVAQMRGLADVAHEFGDGDIRLTVWQNLLISGVPTDRLEDARRRIETLGLAIEANALRSGLVACTGNTGCKFAASDTKRHAEEIARWCETRISLDIPVNIHLTGCHHSCAQHFVAEIGLLACKVQDNEDADPVEGYHVLVGGGFGPDAALGRELYRDVKAEDAPQTVERILKAYLAHRASPQESFIEFARRHDIDALKAFAAEAA